MGLNRTSSVLKDAISQAGAQGHLFIAASGNDGIDNDDPTTSAIFPAAYSLPNMVVVGAMNGWEGAPASSMQLANFSNYGGASVHLAGAARAPCSCTNAAAVAATANPCSPSSSTLPALLPHLPLPQRLGSRSGPPFQATSWPV